MIGRSRNSWGILVFALLLPAAPARAQTGAASSSPASTPVSTLKASQGDYSGSVPSDLVPGVLQLSLQEAMDRGLKQNLGILLSGQDVRTAHGERWKQLSALLPNLTTSSYVDASQVDLAEFGFSFKFPPSSGISIPPVVGPFAYFDSRAYRHAIAPRSQVASTPRTPHPRTWNRAEYSFKDARDLVILAVGNTYLQAIADEARVETADAQVKTAQALYDQAYDQVNAGTSPKIDALRANVELKTRQQDLIQSKNNFAIAKLTLARVIGLAPGQQFELTDNSPYQPFPGLTVDEALKRAYANRSDFQAALADVHAAEYSA